MNVFEILGKLMGEKIAFADIGLYGSFLLTGKGHGTPQALIAGLLGMQPDDERIPMAFEIAEKEGLKFTVGEAKLKEAHPNSVLLKLKGKSGKSLEIIGESIGGSIINIAQIDGLPANISGDYPTLIASNNGGKGFRRALRSEYQHCPNASLQGLARKKFRADCRV